jgi:molybdopterin converting factor small subunit
VADVLALAAARYGDEFVALLPSCKIWVNGEPAEPATEVGPADEVAVLPPVSGG